MECRKWCPLVWPLDLGWQWHSFFTHDETLWHRNACLRLKDGEEGMPIYLSLSTPYPSFILRVGKEEVEVDLEWCVRWHRRIREKTPWIWCVDGCVTDTSRQQQPGNLTDPSLHAPAWCVLSNDRCRQSKAKPSQASPCNPARLPPQIHALKKAKHKKPFRQ